MLLTLKGEKKFLIQKKNSIENYVDSTIVNCQRAFPDPNQNKNTSIFYLVIPRYQFFNTGTVSVFFQNNEFNHCFKIESMISND